MLLPGVKPQLPAHGLISDNFKDEYKIMKMMVAVALVVVVVMAFFMVQNGMSYWTLFITK
jgi:hypothetical protein